MKIYETDILHSGGLENLTDYKIFKRRYPLRASLPTRQLSDWYIQEAPSNTFGSPTKISLVGICNGSIIRTSPVTSIIASRKVCTLNCIYILTMPSKVLENPLRGVEKHFVYGFPSNWEKIIEESHNAPQTNEPINTFFQAETITEPHQMEHIPCSSECNLQQFSIENLKNSSSQFAKEPNNEFENVLTKEIVIDNERESASTSEKIESCPNNLNSRSKKESKHSNELSNCLGDIDSNLLTSMNVLKDSSNEKNSELRASIQSQMPITSNDIQLEENPINIQKRASIDSQSIKTKVTENTIEEDKCHNNSEEKTPINIIEKINSLFYSSNNQNDDLDSNSLNYDESLLEDRSNHSLTGSFVSENPKLMNKRNSEPLKALNFKSNNSSLLIQSKRNSEPKTPRKSLKKVLTVEEFVNKTSPFKSPKTKNSMMENEQSMPSIQTVSENASFLNEKLSNASIFNEEVDSQQNNLNLCNFSNPKVCNDSVTCKDEHKTKKDSFNFSKIDQNLFINARNSLSNDENQSLISPNDKISNSNSIQNIHILNANDTKIDQEVEPRKASIDNQSNLSFNSIKEKKSKRYSEKANSSIQESVDCSQTKNSKESEIANFNKIISNEPNINEINDLKDKNSTPIQSDNMICINTTEKDSNNLYSDINADLSLIGSEIQTFKFNSEQSNEANNLSLQLLASENCLSQNIPVHDDSLIALCEDDSINPTILKDEMISSHLPEVNEDLHLNLSVCSHHSVSNSSTPKKKASKRLKSFKKSISNNNADIIDLSSDTNDISQYNPEDSEQALKRIKSSSFIKIIDDTHKSTGDIDSFIEMEPYESEKPSKKRISIKLSGKNSLTTEDKHFSLLNENTMVDLDDTIVSNLADSVPEDKQLLFNDKLSNKSDEQKDRSFIPVKIVTSLETTDHEDAEIKTVAAPKNKKKKTVLKLPAYFKGKSKKLAKK